MSQEGVKKAIGMMVSDSKFRAAMFRDPKRTVARAGLALDAKELAAISKLKPSDLVIKTSGFGPGKVGKIVVSKLTW